jgi:hypothetical protein
VAVIRGSDGARRMYGIADKLPAVYVERFRTHIYNERVVHPGVWNKLVVVAREDDHATMLDHALIQSRGATGRRGFVCAAVRRRLSSAGACRRSASA